MHGLVTEYSQFSNDSKNLWNKAYKKVTIDWNLVNTLGSNSTTDGKRSIKNEMLYVALWEAQAFRLEFVW